MHGFKGHPVRTWTHKTEHLTKDSTQQGTDATDRPAKIPRLAFKAPHFRKERNPEKVYWPRDLVPESLPNARVLVYGYDTNVRHALGAPISQNTVYDIALDLLVSLEAERRLQQRPLLFVAHSLGGIVVKEALQRSHGFDAYHAHLHQIYECTAAIVFFGTPHGEADPRRLLQLIAEKTIRAAGFTVNEQIVNTLLPSSERLKELRDEFGPMARTKSWTIYCFQEQYGVPLLGGKKVSQLSLGTDASPFFKYPYHPSSS